MIGEFTINRATIRGYHANTKEVTLRMGKRGQPGLLSHMIFALAFCLVATSVAAYEPYYYKSQPLPLKSSPPPYHYLSPPPPKMSPPSPYIYKSPPPPSSLLLPNF